MIRVFHTLMVGADGSVWARAITRAAAAVLKTRSAGVVSARAQRLARATLATLTDRAAAVCAARGAILIWVAGPVAADRPRLRVIDALIV